MNVTIYMCVQVTTVPRNKYLSSNQGSQDTTTHRTNHVRQYYFLLKPNSIKQ